ncbi:MAG: hypothetical protein ACPGC3_08105 [Paracoccaceae bacterium]
MKKLDELQIGDEVGYLAYSAHGRRVIGGHIGKIEKVTKTQITAIGERWMKSTGRMIGCSSYHGVFLRTDTDKVREEIEQAKRAKAAEKFCRQFSAKLDGMYGDDAIKAEEALGDAVSKWLGE